MVKHELKAIENGRSSLQLKYVGIVVAEHTLGQQFDYTMLLIENSPKISKRVRGLIKAGFAQAIKEDNA